MLLIPPLCACRQWRQQNPPKTYIFPHMTCAVNPDALLSGCMQTDDDSFVRVGMLLRGLGRVSTSYSFYGCAGCSDVVQGSRDVHLWCIGRDCPPAIPSMGVQGLQNVGPRASTMVVSSRLPAV